MQQDFRLQSGIEVNSKTVSEQMISPSRRQNAINYSRTRPELTFKDLQSLLGMEVVVFKCGAKNLGHLWAEECRKEQESRQQSWEGTGRGKQNSFDVVVDFESSSSYSCYAGSLQNWPSVFTCILSLGCKIK